MADICIVCNISLLSKQFQLLSLFFVMAIQKITDECGRISLA